MFAMAKCTHNSTTYYLRAEGERKKYGARKSTSDEAPHPHAPPKPLETLKDSQREESRVGVVERRTP